MDQLITLRIDTSFLKRVDDEVKKSIFNKRSQCVIYLLERFVNKRRIDKIKGLFLYLIIMLGFSIVILLLILRV